MTHSYLQLTNEFKFSIAAFHHAHEAYLVPDLLKKIYGAPPAVALFATNARYKREAYRGSEFAPRILADHGIQVVMKVRLLVPVGPSAKHVLHSPITRFWTLGISSTRHSRHIFMGYQRISPLPLSLPHPQKLLALDTALAT